MPRPSPFYGSGGYCDFEPGFELEPADPVAGPLLFCGFEVSALEAPDALDPVPVDEGGLVDAPELPDADGLEEDGLEEDELDDGAVLVPEVPTVALPLLDLLAAPGAVEEPEPGVVVDDEDEDEDFGGVLLPLLLFEPLSPQAARANTPANALAMRKRLSMNLPPD
jgi:hypothetical protein